MSTVAEGNSRYRMLLVPTYSMCDEACVQCLATLAPAS